MKREKKAPILSMILLICILMTCALAGCGSGGNTNSSDAGASDPAATAAGTADSSEAETDASGAAEIDALVIRSAYNYTAGTLAARPYELLQEKVTELSGGAITFETYWGASLLGADEALDGIGTGMADMGNGLPVRTPTLTPLGGFSFYFPFRPTSLSVTYEAAKTMVENFPAFSEEIARHNVKLLAVVPTTSMEVSSTVPVTSYQDLNGLKIASAGSDYNVWESAGAVVVSVAGDSRYENLQRKVIDASFLDLGSVYSDHHYEVAPYITYTGLGALSTVQLWMNMDFWNVMSAAQQNVFTEAIDWAIDAYIQEADATIAEAVSAMEGEGVTFYTLSGEDKKAWAGQMENLPAQYAESLEAAGLPGWEFVEAYLQACTDAGHVWIRDWSLDW